jgi:MFS-type transporter involved in bile tolerance (Atg22 family)
VSDAAHNEQVKLTATYVNNLAVSTFAVGCLAPIFATIYAANPNAAVPAWAVVCISVVCGIASASLHWSARRYLKEMR